MNAIAVSAPLIKPSPKYEAGPIREVLLPVAAVLATILLPFKFVVWAFVIVGHAHFLMAYLYQYRGKKMNTLYFVTALVLFVASVVYFALGIGVTPILIVSGILFALHFAIDEFTLHGEKFSREAWLAIGSFTLLFSSLVLVIALPNYTWVPYVVGGIIIATVIARFIFGKGKPSIAERYLWFVQVLLFILAVGFNLPTSVLGVILLLHFANWYIGYGLRLKSRPERARSYWTEVAATLFICTVLFAIFMASGGVFMHFIFGLSSYYAWAIAHILLSFVSAIPAKVGA